MRSTFDKDINVCISCKGRSKGFFWHLAKFEVTTIFQKGTDIHNDHNKNGETSYQILLQFTMKIPDSYFLDFSQ